MAIDDLQTYAAIAEIFGTITILGGGVAAILQISEYRRRRRYQIATDLCRGFTDPELAKAITLLRSVPDGISAEELHRMGAEFEEAAQIVGMTFETMGLLVYREIASFQIVQELTGGLLLMMWRKINRWVVDTRESQGNPRFAEWVQWLAERIEEREDRQQPAYLKHATWKKHSK